MNGVLLLCLRSGTCLYSKQYREGFGLPAGVVRHTEAVDPMSLAGILYALYLQANAAHSAVPGELPEPHEQEVDDGQRPDGLNLTFNSLSIGETALYFAADRKLEVMMVASLQACVNPAVGSRLAARLLEAVSEQYREYLCKVVRNPRGFKGMSKLLCAVLQELPEDCAKSAMSKLAEASPNWLYVAHTAAFFDAVERHGSEPPPPRQWWQLTRRSSAAEWSPVSLGAFQYLFSSSDEPQAPQTPEVRNDPEVLGALAQVVQRAAEALLAMPVDGGSEHLRSIEIPLDRPASASPDGSYPNTWLEDTAGSSRQAAAGQQLRLLVTIQGDTLVAMPLCAGQGASVMGRVKQLLHEDVAQLRLFMSFLEQNIPEGKVVNHAAAA